MHQDEAVRERERQGPEVDAYLDGSDVGRLVGPDDGELLNRDVRRREARSRKVGRLELGERLLIEVGLELLEDIRKF